MPPSVPTSLRKAGLFRVQILTACAKAIRHVSRAGRLLGASEALRRQSGLAANAVFGWWWADPLAALGVVVFLVSEGREALEAEHVDDCC